VRKIIIFSASGGVIVALFAAGLWYVLNITSTRGQLARARVLSELDRQEALDLIRSSIRALSGDFPEGQLLECQLLLELNRRKDAERAFLAIRRPDQLNGQSLCRLAEKAESLGMWDLAATVYVSAGEYVQHDSSLMKSLIGAMMASTEFKNRTSQILEYCETYSHLWPDDVYPCWISANLYLEMSAPVRAAQSLHDALKRKSTPEETRRIRMALAGISMHLGDLQAAREQCDILQSEAADESSQRSLQVLAAALLQREGKAEMALECLANLPDDGPIFALRGSCRYDLGDYQGAIADLTNAILNNDYDQQSHYLLGQAYLKTQERALAERHLNRSRELNELTAQSIVVKSQLRDDPKNLQLKKTLATLNARMGNRSGPPSSAFTPR
jgi:tetratricopeptide (TPR) repeat protein